MHAKHAWQANRKELDAIATQLGIKIQSNWYSITAKVIKNISGYKIMNRSAGSIVDVLKTSYPEFKWYAWKFHPVSARIWQNQETHKEYFDWLADELGLRSFEDWKNVSTNTINEHGGTLLLLNHYNGLLQRALDSVYKTQAPLSKSNTSNPHKYAFDWIAQQLSIQTQHDWYKVPRAYMLRSGFHGMLKKYYNGSLVDALQNVYPQFEWYPWLFEKTHQQFWNKMENRRAYLTWLASTLGIEHTEDWYGVSTDTFMSTGGAGLIMLYDGSFIKALQGVLPEYQWNVWMFEQASRNFWKDTSNLRSYFDWLAAKLNLKHAVQWYSVNNQILVAHGGRTILLVYGSLMKALDKVYPEYKFPIEHFSSFGQRHFWFLLKTLNISKRDIQQNYRHPQMTHHSLRKMELDVYIPSLGIAFEYQGAQHYRKAFPSGSNQIARDHEKRKICKQLGITLIEVPYWWFGNQSSFLSMMHNVTHNKHPLSEL